MSVSLPDVNDKMKWFAFGIKDGDFIIESSETPLGVGDVILDFIDALS